MELINGTINEIYERVRLDEGVAKLRSFFVYLYRRGPVPVKTLSRHLGLPVPIVSAIKNECKRHGLITAAPGGVALTDTGLGYVREALGYRAADREKLNQVLEAPEMPMGLFETETRRLADIYAGRPTVDTTVDQSLCTAETGMRRALLMLRMGGLFGQRLFFAGDDDMTSLAVWLVMEALCLERDNAAVSMTVMDIDRRILDYIAQTASELGAAITCVNHDLRQPLPVDHIARYDAVFTDPPYTVPGLGLFVSRGIEALKREPDLYVYLSHARKSPASQLETQRMLTDAGLVITQINTGFNQYHGAQILGGVSDLTVLATTRGTRPVVEAAYTAPIYTNEANPRVRLYVCKNCHTPYRVGQGAPVPTIERLKEMGCAACGGDVFLLRNRKTERDEHER